MGNKEKWSLVGFTIDTDTQVRLKYKINVDAAKFQLSFVVFTNFILKTFTVLIKAPKLPRDDI